jgi:hypothetical protein
MLLHNVERGVIALEKFRGGLEAALIGTSVHGVGLGLLDALDQGSELPIGLFHPGNTAMHERGGIERDEIVDQVTAPRA